MMVMARERVSAPVSAPAKSQMRSPFSVTAVHNCAARKGELLWIILTPMWVLMCTRIQSLWLSLMANDLGKFTLWVRSRIR